MKPLLALALVAALLTAAKLQKPAGEPTPQPARAIAAATPFIAERTDYRWHALEQRPATTPTKRISTALDRPVRRAYQYQPAPAGTSEPTDPRRTWSKAPDGRWIEHDSRVGAMQSRGL